MEVWGWRWQKRNVSDADRSKPYNDVVYRLLHPVLGLVHTTVPLPIAKYSGNCPLRGQIPPW